MRVKKRKVADLHTDPSNVRLHSRINLDAIKASLLKFGQQHPLVVTDEGLVVAGNGRLAAMLELGWDDCDTVTTTLDGVALAGFAIADNRTAELAEWDEEALARTLAALSEDDDADVEATGFDAEALAEALAVLTIEPEPEPEPTIPEEHAPADEDREPHASEVEVLQGDCRERMAAMDAESFTAVVCDPPYELAFMGKAWDASGVAFDVATWEAAFRVLKPGGYLLAFGGTRTYHRLAVAIEDAGFEVRDCFAWMYGSGFPKSHDVGKAIDKTNGETGRASKFTKWMRSTGLTAKQLDKVTGTRMGGHYTTAKSQPAIPTRELFEKIKTLLAGSVPAEVEELVDRSEAEREVVGRKKSSLGGTVAAGDRDAEYILEHKGIEFDITAPATELAREWHGYGTALKPAYEPCIIARKPLVGTVAQNVAEHECGALNVDGARLGTEDNLDGGGYKSGDREEGNGYGFTIARGGIGDFNQPTGRWPANVLLDEDAACILDGQTATDSSDQHEGGASRFFYTAKASTSERTHDGKVANTHATVKPIAVMRYLLNLVKQPKTNRILDPFAGSGTTLIAAIREGLDVVGIELDEKHISIIEARVAHEPNATTKDQA